LNPSLGIRANIFISRYYFSSDFYAKISLKRNSVLGIMRKIFLIKDKKGKNLCPEK